MSELVENRLGGLTVVVGPPCFLRAKKLPGGGDPTVAVSAAQSTSEVHVRRVMEGLMQLARLTRALLAARRKVEFVLQQIPPASEGEAGAGLHGVACLSGCHRRQPPT